ncbi:MAG: phosphoribosylformylglycinamidine synthase I [Patescibacteria group bacterium]
MAARPEVGVLFTEGTNCDRETIDALDLAGATGERVHLSELEAGGQDLADYEALVVPGGFSYGDDVASGRVLAVELRTRLAEQLRDFTEKDEKPVVGICNGFQVLVKSGLLPEGSIDADQRLSLTGNDSNRFEWRWTTLGYNRDNNCVFLDGAFPTESSMQVAHGEGKLVVPSDEFRELGENQQVVFQYLDERGHATEEYPWNPNGSVEGVTGITDRTGRILGMMPHPERSIRPEQTPPDSMGHHGVPGRRLFEGLVGYVRNS